MDFLSTMKAKAKADKKVIVLPESYEKRNLEAAAECLKEELADIILIGKKDKIMEAAGSFDVSKAIFVDPETYDRMDEMVAGLAEARKSKGMTLEEARKILMDDSLFVAVMLVKMGVADGMVSFHGRYPETRAADSENCTRHRAGILFLHHGYKDTSVWR